MFLFLFPPPQLASITKTWRKKKQEKNGGKANNVGDFVPAVKKRASLPNMMREDDASLLSGHVLLTRKLSGTSANALMSLPVTTVPQVACTIKKKKGERDRKREEK